MSAITVFRTFVAATLCTALAACAMGPDFVRPQAELPGHWRAAASSRDAASWRCLAMAQYCEPGRAAHTHTQK